MSFDYFKVLRELKSKPCSDCGQAFDPVCMDLDHRPDEKKSGAIVKFRYDEKKFWAEVAKCDLVCSNCHRLRTKKRGYSVEARKKLRKPKPSGFGEKISKLKLGVPISPESRHKMGRPKAARTVVYCDRCQIPITLLASDRRLKQTVVFCSITCRYA